MSIHARLQDFFFAGGEIRGTEDRKSPALSGVEFWWDRGIIIIIIITRLMTHVKSFTKWRIVSVGGHESAKVSSVVKFSLYQTLESGMTGEVGHYI